MTTHLLTDYPKDLQKKITLLQHFRSYLENNNQGSGAVSGKSENTGDIDMDDESRKA